MGRLTVADAKRMCTKAELGVVMGSRPDAIETLSADQLKKNVASARRQSGPRCHEERKILAATRSAASDCMGRVTWV